MPNYLPDGTVLHTHFSRYTVDSNLPINVPDNRIGVRDPDGKPTYIHPSNITRIEQADSAPLTRGSVSNSFGRAATSDGWNEGLVELAADHGRTVAFNYTDAAGVRSDREVVPEAVHTSAAGDQYFVATDEEGDEIRAFRFDRIDGSVEPV